MIKQKLFRTVDANFNRAKEGLRVCEDLCRFVLDHKASTRKIKNIRHELSKILGPLYLKQIIKARDIQKDVGKATSNAEVKRKGSRDLFFANIQRVKVSIRVLEEFSKVLNRQVAEKLKRLRYKVYALEKEVVEEL